MTKKTETAKTAQEVKEKYGRKRFNSSNAGESVIYAYIYWGYLKNEGVSNEEIATQPLYKDLDAIRAKVETVEDALKYNVYVHLQEWLANAFETAVFMKNATSSAISHFYSIASSTIAAENLRKALGEKAEENNISLWLSTLSADHLRPTTATYETALSLRKNIEKGLRYLNVFNTLIQLIANATDIPELVLFQINISSTHEIIDKLNEALEVLREEISAREVVPDDRALTTYPPLFTERAMSATLEAFRDVEKDAPRIPEENITNTERNLKLSVLTGAKAWTNLFTLLSKDYWRR